MEKGVAVYLNGIGYYFSDYEILADLLDMNCDKNVNDGQVQDGVVYEDDSEV